MALRGWWQVLVTGWTDGSAGRGHSICKSRTVPQSYGEKWLEGVVRAECQHQWAQGEALAILRLPHRCGLEGPCP